ncbi:nuclear transport factor 2 family protein [Salinirubrum litoreum]|uniref:Nuclear transport factor 2 family protein n=1 Tax=Salinirubrum litoreum TaxID=1126234 RepID=A0ABD5RF70_9EURY
MATWTDPEPPQHPNRWPPNLHPTVAPVDLVADYYRALDTHDYDALQNVLDPGFVQHRPDRRFDSREAFVRFVRDDRPQSDTTHRVHTRYVPDAEADGTPDATEVLARGEVLSAEGDLLVRFVDRFRIVAGSIVELETFTR